MSLCLCMLQEDEHKQVIALKSRGNIRVCVYMRMAFSATYLRIVDQCELKGWRWQEVAASFVMTQHIRLRLLHRTWIQAGADRHRERERERGSDRVGESPTNGRQCTDCDSTTSPARRNRPGRDGPRLIQPTALQHMAQMHSNRLLIWQSWLSFFSHPPSLNMVSCPSMYHY